jgi:putative nucleotidyltransferase with HDIG domain
MTTKRLLFVDDDKMVLSGLRRALHEMRGEWEMSFATGGQEALEIMEQQRFDAVITDMRMPMMDGAELLERVKDRYPEVIRIVLSGQSEKEEMFRSIIPAHQYLAKPCDIRELKLRLSQTFASRDLVQDPSIVAAIARLRSIPSLPTIYSELTAALQSDLTSLAQIESVVAKDVGMATKILQLANSAFIGAHGRVSSLRQAVSLIGVETVRTLTLSIHVFSRFSSSSNAAPRLSSLWDHSVEVAALAQQIAMAETGRKSLAEECFSAGLLHDLGKVILLGERPGEYSSIINAPRTGHEDTEAMEIAVVGCSHAQLGAYLMSMWGLPTSLVQAVGYHHHPSHTIEEGFSTLTAAHCANALCHSAKQAQPIDQFIDTVYLDRLGLSGKLAAWSGFLKKEEGAAAGQAGVSGR